MKLEEDENNLFIYKEEKWADDDGDDDNDGVNDNDADDNVDNDDDADDGDDDDNDAYARTKLNRVKASF